MGWAAWLGGLVASAALLGALDTARGVLRMPEAGSPLLLLGTWCVSTGALLALAAPILALRRALRERIGDGALATFGMAVLEAAVLCGFGILLEEMASVTMTVRVLVSLAIALPAGVLALVVRRWPRLSPWACAALALGTVIAVELLPFREKPLLRSSLDLAFMASGAALLAQLGFARVRVRSSAALFAVVALVLAGQLTHRSAAEVRSNVQVFTPHAQAFLNPLSVALALVSPPSRIGSVRCGTERASPPLERPVSTLAGTASGADVLWVSVDALRWDQADGLAALFDALGPHARFSRAVSPAPRTLNSLAAILRGVPARQVAYDGDSSDDAVSAAARPTLGTVLRQRGYRAVHIPTHRYFEPRRRINAGFELVLPDGFAETFDTSRGKPSIVSAEAAFATARRLASDTKEPLFVWIHLMEPHEPYRWNGGMGPDSKAGQMRAIRDVASKAAELVRFMREARAPRPLIVATFGDHGEEFGEHGYQYHSTSVFAEQVRVGMALSAPGMRSVRVDAPVTPASLPATILELLGMEPASSFTEPSLLACIERGDGCPRVAVSQMLKFGSWIAYTGERFRLLVDPTHGVRRLYDSANDPLETHDLSHSESDELARIEALAAELDARYCVD